MSKCCLFDGESLGFVDLNGSGFNLSSFLVSSVAVQRRLTTSVAISATTGRSIVARIVKSWAILCGCVRISGGGTTLR